MNNIRSDWEIIEELPEAGSGYKVVRSSERKGKTHKVTGPDGTVKFFGDSKLGQHPKDPARKKAFYARHKKNLDGNPYFRAFARKTWAEGGELNDWEILDTAQDGKYLKDNDSTLENLVEFVDPTGLSSWDDVYRSYQNTGLSPQTGLEVLGALPLLGKIGKSGKVIAGGTDLLHTLAPIMKNPKAQKALYDTYRTYKNVGGDKLDKALGYTTQLLVDNTKLFNPTYRASSDAAINTINKIEKAARLSKAKDFIPTSEYKPYPDYQQPIIPIDNTRVATPVIPIKTERPYTQKAPLPGQSVPTMDFAQGGMLPKAQEGYLSKKERVLKTTPNQKQFNVFAESPPQEEYKYNIYSPLSSLPKELRPIASEFNLFNENKNKKYFETIDDFDKAYEESRIKQNIYKKYLKGYYGDKVADGRDAGEYKDFNDFFTRQSTLYYPELKNDKRFYELAKNYWDAFSLSDQKREELYKLNEEAYKYEQEQVKKFNANPSNLKTSDYDTTFESEAKNLKNVINKITPEVKTNIYPYYGYEDTSKIKDVLSKSTPEDQLAIFGHHGNRYLGIDNEWWKKQLTDTKYKDCYLGSCFSKDIAQGWNLPNFHYRPDDIWLGVNPNSSNINDAMWSRSWADSKDKAEIVNPTYGKEYATNTPNLANIARDAGLTSKFKQQPIPFEFKQGGKIKLKKAQEGTAVEGYAPDGTPIYRGGSLHEVEVVAQKPKSLQPFQKGYVNPKIMTSQTGEEGLGDDLGGMMVTAALAPGSLPFRASSRLGRVALGAAELANPVSGFRGIKPKFALQNADPIITNQTKGFNVEYDGLLDFQKKADFEPYRFDNKKWYDVPEQSQIDLDKISKLKSIKPSEYFDRRQFVKELVEKGIVSKKTDIQKYARSLEDTEDLTKRAIEQANTYYRGVTPKIPTKTDIGLGGRDIDQNKVIKAMQDAGVDLSNEEEIGKYMASHVPLYQFGYRSGVGDARGLDALYTSKGHSSYGDMTFELKKPFNFSEGSYKDWLNTYETPSPIYEDIQKIRELEWKKNFPEKKGSYYMSNENFNAEYPKWMIPYKYGDHIFMGKKGERIFDNVKKVEGEIGRTKSKDLPYKNGGKVKLKPKSSNWEILPDNEWEII